LSNDRPEAQSAAFSHSFETEDFCMDKELQTLLFEQWKNGACLGYVIIALENFDYDPKKIQEVVCEMRELFDWISIDQAEKHYCNSPY